jgi:enoyl-CoA hydratase/carnithine racemase
LKETSLKYAKQIASNPNAVLPMIKKSIQHAYKNDLGSTLELLSSFQGIAQRLSDHFEALDRFHQRSKK